MISDFPKANALLQSDPDRTEDGARLPDPGYVEVQNVDVCRGKSRSRGRLGHFLVDVSDEYD